MQNFNGAIEFSDKETIQKALDNFDIVLKEAEEMKKILIQRMKETKVKYWFFFNTSLYDYVNDACWGVTTSQLKDIYPEEFTNKMYNTFWYYEHSVPYIIKQLVSVDYDKIYLTPTQAEFISYYTKE